ncbi:Kinesin light chain [Seminavis robusta]|uniref:Kinesin light chain n=1 Tax=Seminavis robusta TaxID=568900 RepID=A0A9N8H0F4_9STRA|nr:Kinesin light chain [Seminavis robusta]|eukprot:Sro20_g013870.1 Kinesin light chain (2186) ;mRNA; r:18534-25164
MVRFGGKKKDQATARNTPKTGPLKFLRRIKVGSRARSDDSQPENYLEATCTLANPLETSATGNVGTGIRQNSVVALGGSSQDNTTKIEDNDNEGQLQVPRELTAGFRATGRSDGSQQSNTDNYLEASCQRPESQGGSGNVGIPIHNLVSASKPGVAERGCSVESFLGGLDDNGDCTQWSCSSCAFTGNPESFMACFQCNEPRSPHTDTNSTNAIRGSSAGSTGWGMPMITELRSSKSGRHWSCNFCTFAGNFEGKSSCELCGTPRGRGSGGSSAFMVPFDESSSREEEMGQTGDNSNVQQEIAHEIGGNKTLANYVLQGDIFSLVYQASGAGTEDPRVQVQATWGLMKLAKEDAGFRKLMLSHGCFACFSEIFSKAEKHTNYILKTLAALTLAYMLAAANQDTLHYMKFEIKESLDYLCAQCNEPLFLGGSTGAIVSVEEIILVGQTKGTYRHRRQQEQRQYTPEAAPQPIPPTVAAPPPMTSLTSTTSTVAEGWIKTRRQSMTMHQDARAMFRRLDHSPIDSYTAIWDPLKEIFELVTNDNNMRSQVIALDSLSLKTLIRFSSNGSDFEMLNPKQRGKIRALASLVVAYVLCSHESMLSVMVYSEQIEECLGFLEGLSTEGHLITSEALNVSAHQLRYLPMAARRCLKVHMDLLQTIPGSNEAPQKAYTRFCRLIQTSRRCKDVSRLIELMQHNVVVQNPSLQMASLVALMNHCSQTEIQQQEAWDQSLVDCLLPMYLASAKNDRSLRTILALIVVQLVLASSERLYFNSGHTQQNSILDMIEDLCKATQDVNLHYAVPAKALDDDDTEMASVEIFVTEMIGKGERARGLVAREPAEAKGMPESNMFALNGVSLTPEPVELVARSADLPPNPMVVQPIQPEDLAALLSNLNPQKNDRATQLTAAATLMANAEKRKVFRERMIDLEAFEPLLLAYTQCNENDYKLRTAIALTVAHILRSSPQKLRMTLKQRRRIDGCLSFLRSSRKDVVLNGKTIVAESLLYLGNQARGYFEVISQRRQESKRLLMSVGKNEDGMNEVVPAPSLTRVRSSRPQEETVQVERPNPKLQLPQTTLTRQSTVGGSSSGIVSALFFLGSTEYDRRVDAAVALMKIAKESPTQRVLMHNYGLVPRMVDIVQSRDGGESSKLRLLAAMTVAYVAPSSHHDLFLETHDIQECTGVLLSHGNASVAVNDMVISNQELLWATENLRRYERRQSERERDPVFLSTDGNKSPANCFIDLQEIFRKKHVTSLIEIVSTGSCRQFDAALLLLAMVKKDKKHLQEIVSSRGIDVLLTVFFQWEDSSDDLRVAIAMLVTSIAPFVQDPSDKQQLEMAQCVQFTQDRQSTTQRMIAKAANKVASRELKLEPTSYNYMKEDGFLGVVKLNSLGLVSETGSWLWQEINSCTANPSEQSAVSIVMQDLSKADVVLNVMQPRKASQLFEDVSGRLTFSRKRERTNRSSSFLKVPRIKDISCADQPDFLGVSVYHLKHHFLPAVTATQGLSKHSKFYEIENLKEATGFVRRRGQHVRCPLDGRMGAAYVHCLQGEDHVGIANHMLSWTWSYSVSEVVETLDGYCQTHDLDPTRTYVWLCCLCLNQHRVFQSNLSGIQRSASTLDFENEFQRRVLGIGRVLVMMQPWADPKNLRRAWCIFEIFMGLVTENCEVSFVMTRTERDRMAIRLFSSFGGAEKTGVDLLYSTLNQVDLEQAQSSVQQDKDRILDLIRQRIGFEEVNLIVRDRLRAWVKSVIDGLVAERERLEEQRVMDDSCLSNESLTRGTQLSHATFLKQVGDIYALYGDFRSAEQMYTGCLADRVAVLGTDHLDVAEAYTKIGKALAARGYHGEAIDVYLKALRIRGKHLARNHLDLATTYVHIGRLLHEMGDVQESLTIMRKALAIQEESLGQNHRESALTSAHIAILLGECSEREGTCAQGLQMAQKALGILQGAVGNQHPDTAFCFFSIGALLQNICMDEALSAMDQCRCIQEKVLGNQHVALATTYGCLGEMLRREGRLRDAMKRFRQALSVLQHSHSHMHISIIRVYAHMAVVACMLQDHEEADDLHEAVVAFLHTCPIQFDSKLLRIYSAAAEGRYRRGDQSTALRLFRQSLEVKEAMLGENDPSLPVGYDMLDLLGDVQGEDDCVLLEEFKSSLSLLPVVSEGVGASIEERAPPPKLLEGVTTQWLERRRCSV